ncbi:biofilm regulation diguanylate cyclase SiaD [Thermomonas brevis]|nr:biofilm regulation diguanylate cyclase SiaD [Thermomonas brevis]
MNGVRVDIDAMVEALLADSTYAGHPLHSALAALWELYLTQAQRLDRIARLSDRVQFSERVHERTRTERFEKQLRQLEKMTRISDRYQDMMHELNSALQQASTHDALTSLPNRRLLNDRLKQEAARSKRLETPLCIGLLDIDHFKQVNDTFGHDAGDEVLRTVACATRDSLREYDLCGRWGGEEFLLLLPAISLEDAEATMQRLTELLHGLRFDCLSEEYRISASIGLTAYRQDERPEDAVARADAALLEAKRGGRNRVTVAA